MEVACSFKSFRSHISEVPHVYQAYSLIHYCLKIFIRDYISLCTFYLFSPPPFFKTQGKGGYSTDEQHLLFTEPNEQNVILILKYL